MRFLTRGFDLFFFANKFKISPRQDSNSRIDTLSTQPQRLRVTTTDSRPTGATCYENERVSLLTSCPCVQTEGCPLASADQLKYDTMSRYVRNSYNSSLDYREVHTKPVRTYDCCIIQHDKSIIFIRNVSGKMYIYLVCCLVDWVPTCRLERKGRK